MSRNARMIGACVLFPAVNSQASITAALSLADSEPL
jgi:hypothetical protein